MGFGGQGKEQRGRQATGVLSTEAEQKRFEKAPKQESAQAQLAGGTSGRGRALVSKGIARSGLAGGIARGVRGRGNPALSRFRRGV